MTTIQKIQKVTSKGQITLPISWRKATGANTLRQMNSSAGWELKIKDRIYKELSEFPARDRKRILEIIERLPFNPYAGDVEKMKGEESAWRRRTGNYRIFYEIIIVEKLIYVYKIERRTSKTY